MITVVQRLAWSVVILFGVTFLTFTIAFTCRTSPWKSITMNGLRLTSMLRAMKATYDVFGGSVLHPPAGHFV